MDKINVWFVEDDPDWLRGLTAYLGNEPDIDIVFSSSRRVFDASVGRVAMRGLGG